MPFVFDPTSTLPGISQFDNYLDNQFYLNGLHRNVKDVTNYQLIEVRKAIQRNTVEVQSSINTSVRNICGSLEEGFGCITNEIQKVSYGLENISNGIDDINWRLNEINEGIAELHSLIDWKTDLIIEQQKISNSYLAAITKGVYLTERKKLNIQHNKDGNILLKNAIAEGPDSKFFIKAHREFTDAHNNDVNDYFPLKQLGFIYYSSKELRDVKNAEYHFKESAINALAFSIEPSYKNQLTIAAASSLYYASFCNYILNIPNEAIKQIRQAVFLTPDKLKYNFRLAKYLAAFGGEIEAANILREIIEIERLYCIEVLKDQDLIAKKPIQDMLDAITNKLVSEVDREIVRIKNIATTPSNRSIIRKIEVDFNPRTYLNARMTFDKLFF